MGLLGSSMNDMEIIRDFLSDDFNDESILLLLSIQKNDRRKAEEAAILIANKYSEMKKQAKTLQVRLTG